MAAITPDDARRIGAHLRRALRSPTLNVDLPAGRNATAELRIGRDVVGTVDQVDDEGERSWAVTLVVLPEDLAA